MKYVPAAALALLALASVSSAPAQESGRLSARAATHEPTLEEVKAATERFQDVNVALAEGYVPDPTNTCETAELIGAPAEAGAMGIHYLRPDQMLITAVEPRVDGASVHTDFLKPSVLIYEPQADGSLELVAVENLVFRQAWEAAGHTAAPSFLGRAYDLMVDDPATAVDESHHFTPHYDLHVWLYRENPNGVFTPLNPAVTCAHHRQEVGEPMH